MKKALVIMTICTCLLLSVGIMAQAEVVREDISETVYWTFDTASGVLTISGTGDMPSFESPGSIDVPWYKYEDEVRTMVIEEGITSLCDGTFWYVNNLESISIPNTVVKIVGNMWEEALYYKNPANWENGGLYCGNYLLAVDPNYSGDFYIKEGTIAVAGSTFYNCKRIERIYIPQSLVNISAISYCKNLKEIVVDENNLYYKSVDGNLFSKNGEELVQYAIGKREDTYVIPDGVKRIAGSAFSDCDYIVNVTIPNGVQRIEGSAFMQCDRIVSITIPDSIEYIGGAAFNSCTSLSDINLPNHNIEFESTSFWGTAYHKDGTNWVSGIYMNGAFYIGNHLLDLGYKTQDEVLVVRDGTLSIANGLMDHYEGTIKKVVLPSTVPVIGKYTFATTTAIEVNVPYGIVRIDEFGFAGADYTMLYIPDSVVSIGDYAFNYTTKLEYVNIPASVTHIGEGAFHMAKNLKVIEVSEDNMFYSSEDGVLFNKDKTVLLQYPEGKNESTYIVPNGVREISGGALYQNENIEKIVLPQGLESIASGTFWECRNLKTVVIPKSVKIIYTHAFGGNPSLCEVYYEGSIEDWWGVRIYTGNESLMKQMINVDYVYQ